MAIDKLTDLNDILRKTLENIGDIERELGEIPGVEPLPSMPEPRLFTKTEALDAGFDLDERFPEDFNLKLTPDETGAFKVSYVTPDNFEVDIDNNITTPEGETFTVEEFQDYLQEFPEPQIMEVTEVEPSKIEPVAAIGITEQAKAAWSKTPWLAPPAKWSEAVKGFPGLSDIMQWIAPTKFGAALGVVGAGLEKYVGRPWEIAILEARSRVQLAAGWGTASDKVALDRLDSAFDKYGLSAVFSEEITEIWTQYVERPQPGYMKGLLEASQWLNPAYLIPIGGTFGFGVRVTSKIPILGKVMKYTAAGVRAAEKGATYPVAKPLELGAKGFQKAGVKLGEKVANSLIKQSDNLLLEIPETEKLLSGVLVDNWMKRTLQVASKVPGVRTGIEKGLGWRILVDKSSKVVQEVAGRGAVVHAEISRMGLNARSVVLQDLRSIEMNPVKLFGFNERAYSAKMVERLLPDYKGIAEAGTLEHVFTHPTMYNWQGLEKGLEYVTRVNDINNSMLNLLKAEGVPPKHVHEDWIHRVVTGRTQLGGAEIPVKGKPGVAGKAIGKKPSYEKPRTFETMAEGLQEGIKYDPNIEASVGTYIEEAFNKIAGERFMKYTTEFGVTPSERMLERFPEVVQVAELTKTELADAARFHSVINRAIRGEHLPEQTLRAMERRFPEMGKRLSSTIKAGPMNPIDEAAYVAEYGDKDMFGFPQSTTLKSLNETEWNMMSIPERVTWVKNLGLEGKSGSKAWEKLTAEEKGLLSTGNSVKPQIKGIKGLESEASFNEVKLEATQIDKKAELEALRKEAKALVESRKAPYWQARAERAAKMEIARQPGIGEGYIMQPFAGGKIYTQEFIDAFNKFFGYDPGLKVLRATSDVAGILRITKAALDFSQMAIQGLPSWGLAHAYMLFNPVIGTKLMGSWYKAFGLSVASFFKPEVFAKYMGRMSPKALERVSFGGSSKAVDYFAALQTAGWTERALGKIPLKPYHRAEISFFAAGEVVRNEFWEILSKKALAKGQEFELARFLDRITGLTEARYLGVPTTVRQIEQSFLWFAPNYTRACLTVLADIFRGGMTGTEVRKALGGMIAAGGAMYSGVQYGLASMEGKSSEEAWDKVMEGFGIVEDPISREMEWKPSARFMTIKIGNYNFGFGGFWYGLLRLSGNIMACVKEVGERERIDLVRILKHGSLNKKDNPFIYWWYSRSSPFFGTGFELAEGKAFLGYPIESIEEYAKYIATRFEPIWMEQGINWMIPGFARDNEIPEGLAREALIPAEVFGLRTFPESTWVNFYDKADEHIKRMRDEDFTAYTDPEIATGDDRAAYQAWKEGKLTWAQLPDVQKTALLKRYSDLADLYEQAQVDSAIRDSDNWKAWEGVTGEAKDTYYERGDNLIDRVKTGELNTRELREMWSDAGQNYGITLDTIENDPHYEQIYNRFTVLEEKGDKYEFTANIALSEYNQIMFTEYFDEKGDIDWDRKDDEIDAFIEKWGEEMYSVIRDMYADKRLLAGLNPALIRMAEDKDKLGREYWRLPYKPIFEMDEEDQANGDIPAQYYSLWREYQAIEDADEREAFVENNPDFGKDWRAQYRKENAEADAMLALWGYSGKLQSMEAYEKVVKSGRDLSIPLEQMGLGLPPRSLIQYYFEHADLVRETSGNSIETRLYKLEHPEFLDWGVQNWGWDDLSDESIISLRLRVKHKDKFELYESYGDRQSENYIENDDLRRQEREILLTDIEFRDDRRRVEAIKLEIPDEYIEDYVEYFSLDTDRERTEWLLKSENEDYYHEVWLGVLGHQPVSISYAATMATHLERIGMAIEALKERQ